MERFKLVAACAAICASACGGGTTGTSASAASGAGGASATQGADSASAASGSSGAGGLPKGPPSPVVFNEISAKGADWIELGNSGDAEVDLDGHVVCDSDANGNCDLSNPLRFPSGTKLAPKAYLLILGGEPEDAGVGPHAECAPTGLTSCLYVPWKVSASNGEYVFLVSPNQEIVSSLLYPKDAVLAGQTWGRLPDLTGDPAANTPTPGAANAPP
jgi:hypothetical protein